MIAHVAKQVVLPSLSLAASPLPGVFTHISADSSDLSHHSLHLRRRGLVVHAFVPLVMLFHGGGLANAVCSCPGGLDSCVCDDSATPSTSFGGYGKRVRADAAGRDAENDRREREAFLSKESTSLPKATSLKRAEVLGLSDSRVKRNNEFRTQAASDQVAKRGYTGAADAEYGGLTGGGTQTYVEVDPAKARARFAEIVAKTVEKREAAFGFELDERDIRSLEDVLRIKYCGPTGLIGPC